MRGKNFVALTFRVRVSLLLYFFSKYNILSKKKIEKKKKKITINKKKTLIEIKEKMSMNAKSFADLVKLPIDSDEMKMYSSIIVKPILVRDTARSYPIENPIELDKIGNTALIRETAKSYPPFELDKIEKPILRRDTAKSYPIDFMDLWCIYGIRR